MFTDLARRWIDDRLEEAADYAPEAGPAPRFARYRRGDARDLEITLEWVGGAAALRRAVAPIASREQFTLARVEPTVAGDGLWRCRLRHDGREPDLEHQILALLRRLGATTRWVSVIRVDSGERAAADAGPDWDAFSARPLP